jgi:hypothetical protein
LIKQASSGSSGDFFAFMSKPFFSISGFGSGVGKVFCTIGTASSISSVLSLTASAVGFDGGFVDVTGVVMTFPSLASSSTSKPAEDDIDACGGGDESPDDIITLQHTRYIPYVNFIYFKNS